MHKKGFACFFPKNTQIFGLFGKLLRPEKRKREIRPSKLISLIINSNKSSLEVELRLSYPRNKSCAVTVFLEVLGTHSV